MQTTTTPTVGTDDEPFTFYFTLRSLHQGRHIELCFFECGRGVREESFKEASYKNHPDNRSFAVDVCNVGVS